MYLFTIVERMITAAKQVLSNNGCDLKDIRYSVIRDLYLYSFLMFCCFIRMGFHWPPFYSIGHMHLHVISPVSSMSTLNRYVAFNPSFSYVFVDVRIQFYIYNIFLCVSTIKYILIYKCFINR